VAFERLKLGQELGRGEFGRVVLAELLVDADGGDGEDGDNAATRLLARCRRHESPFRTETFRTEKNYGKNYNL
jgi:hypothetical protein